MNEDIKEKLKKTGIAVPEILFPDTELESWACIACDQYTSEPEYRDDAEKIVSGKASSLNLIMPESWLGLESRKSHEENIPSVMKDYLSSGVLKKLEPGFMYIKRETSTGTRRGILALLDLSQYEYAPFNKALCRATEMTVEDRLPVRIKIREKASFEMPHVMVLFSDPTNMLMKKLDDIASCKSSFYSFELMKKSGHITGFHITEDRYIDEIADILLKLKSEALDGMLYAVGDGNHSLAAAKKCGDRYALVELVNIYDEALVFEPIHRLKKDGEVVDYIHGKENCLALAEKLGLEAEIRPDYPKEKLFSDVIEKGVLEKKTFSMGKASDKRFYLECCARDACTETGA